ncbi:OsmC-like protein [Legionella nautarum]|uniref:OsmC-like protein n=1 Tax=Legionella nautarum TaxID=45070 RepID=A0A0W0WRY7_9GAMM|nr:OsmC family protein [Legionella nautarum]KTD35055.1 OsmC-like protein [Legionella nautarum]
MSEYNIRLLWERESDNFNYQTYNRKHTVFFYGGPKLEVNTSAHFIRNPQFHCPEELLTASLSSCFLLTFLSLCAKKGYVVDSYADHATCSVDEVQHAVSHIFLSPTVSFKDENKPDKKAVEQLFEATHHRCFIANSLKASITVTYKIVEKK